MVYVFRVHVYILRFLFSSTFFSLCRCFRKKKLSFRYARMLSNDFHYGLIQWAYYVVVNVLLCKYCSSSDYSLILPLP